MNTVLRPLIVLISLMTGSVGVAPAWAQDGGRANPLIEVFIDARQPAYVIYQGVAADTSPLARQEMSGYSGLDGVTLVPWSVFRDNVDRYVAAGMRINEYPRQRTALGVLAMLKAKPGRPVAITWNGGIATSFFDFQHAVEVFEEFQENPVEYEKKRAAGAFGDPLNPEVQIKAMLGG